MSKKSKNSSLGRLLIKDRFGHKARSGIGKDSFLHTSELKDGYDWNKVNLRSVTEQDSFQEFLSTAELAGTEFTAEKLNVTFVNPKSSVGLLSEVEAESKKKLHRERKDLLKIPRRPHWDANTTAEELQANERQTFLEWRKTLSLFQEETGVLLTPYEKNLDFWRQLWRVVERSDVIVQIVDARNPMLYRCEDLEKYACEVDKGKHNLVLCNKADFLTGKQRRVWAKYFESIGVKAVFFSATNNPDTTEQEAAENSQGAEDSGLDSGEENEDLSVDDDDYITEEEIEEVGVEGEDSVTITESIKNSAKLLSREELLQVFREYKDKVKKDVVTIGLVGYPNVGKSSTINSLLTYKKVPVSATPGKTKHFQTVFLDKDVLLCDCPGLVMPSFVLTKADMVLNGILPIDQMRDHVPSVNLLCTLIPRHILESKYGIMIPKPEEGEDPNRPPHSEELLNPYAYNRGFMTANGQPDNARAARYVLKDFVHGRLLYCYAPPEHDQNNYHQFAKPIEKLGATMTPHAQRAVKLSKPSSKDVDRKFFNEIGSTVHRKGIEKYDSNGVLKVNSEYAGRESNTQSKPWKNHKDKRNKHVKLRVKYRYLDE